MRNSTLDGQYVKGIGIPLVWPILGTIFGIHRLWPVAVGYAEFHWVPSLWLAISLGGQYGISYEEFHMMWPVYPAMGNSTSCGQHSQRTHDVNTTSMQQRIKVCARWDWVCHGKIHFEWPIWVQVL